MMTEITESSRIDMVFNFLAFSNKTLKTFHLKQLSKLVLTNPTSLVFEV